MKKLLVLILCWAVITAKAQNRSITFEQGTWAAVKQKALAENKLIFVDAYTSWCGPCKWLAKNVFTNDSVADYYNAHFICYSVDMEKGEGPMLAAMYRIDAYPTLLYLNFNGKMVHRAAGSMPPAEFIATGKTAFDPSQRMEEWKEKYMSGNRDPAFIREYLKKLSGASMETQEIADWYFATQKNEDLLTKENFEMIVLFLHNTESSLFQYFFANRNKYITIVGNEKVENEMAALYNEAFDKCYDYTVDTVAKNYIRHVIDSSYNKERELIKNSGYEKADELLANADISYYEAKQDWKKYADATISYVNKYKMNDWELVNNSAWSFYKNDNVTDKIYLTQALEWVKKSVGINSNYQNNDTYASLLYKLKKKKEAMKAAETAIVLGKKENQDFSSTVALLVKIKAMK